MSYVYGLFWDDTIVRVPVGALAVEVSLHYQTASREYVTFLRDENRTNDAGDILYEQWELTGKSPPVLMAVASVALQAPPRRDAHGKGMVDLGDWCYFVWCSAHPGFGCAEVDADSDGDLDLHDAAEMQLGMAN